MRAINDRLTYEMNYYSNNRKEHTMVTVRSAAYLCRLIKEKLLICDGCDVANQMREMKASVVSSCPLCRESVPETYEEVDKLK